MTTHTGDIVSRPRAWTQRADDSSDRPVADFTEAFPALYDRAYKVAFRLLGQRAPAQDAAQETLARAFLRWRKVAPHATAWSVRVATNVALDQLRTRARDTRRHRELVTRHLLLEGANQRDDPARGERTDLVNALKHLPRRQREVVVLRYFADLSEHETAAALGISDGSVKAHASRGLSALRKLLASADPPTPPTTPLEQ